MTVLILGCGYVGLELGKRLSEGGESGSAVAEDNPRVIGVRRSYSGIQAIEAAGFEAVQADITDPGALSTLPDAETVVFAASSGGRGASAARDIYVEGQRTVLEAFGSREQAPDRYVYTSSTGVFGDHGGDWVDEETPLSPTTERARTLLEAEELALETARSYGIDGTVARLAGIYGPDRYRLSRYLDGPVTEGYLNMIHRDDIAGALAHLLDADVARGETVLLVDDEPVSKWEFADWLAAECGVESPPKQTKAERLDDASLPESARQRIQADKRCSNERLRELGYELQYPTFRAGYRERIRQYLEQKDNESNRT